MTIFKALELINAMRKDPFLNYGEDGKEAIILAANAFVLIIYNRRCPNAPIPQLLPGETVD